MRLNTEHPGLNEIEPVLLSALAVQPGGQSSECCTQCRGSTTKGAGTLHQATPFRPLRRGRCDRCHVPCPTRLADDLLAACKLGTLLSGRNSQNSEFAARGDATMLSSSQVYVFLM
eukprot:1344276-Amphidinium_carterae.2